MTINNYWVIGNLINFVIGLVNSATAVRILTTLIWPSLVLGSSWVIRANGHCVGEVWILLTTTRSPTCILGWLNRHLGLFCNEHKYSEVHRFQNPHWCCYMRFHLVKRLRGTSVCSGTGKERSGLPIKKYPGVII